MRATVQVTAAVLAVALLAAPAAGQGERAEIAMPFKAVTPGTESGLNMDLRYYHPENREEKPPAISKLALHLPQGTRIDPTALPVCEASNEDFQARGRDACPAETKVGEGKLDAYLGGPGDPQSTDVVLYNGPGELIELILFEGTNNTAALERLKIDGATLSANPAQVPPFGPPEARVAASRITWDIPANGRYLVTPPTCAGVWTTSGEFEFADGGKATASATQACERRGGDAPAGGPVGGQRPGGGDAPARSLRVTVGPTRIVRGRASRVRVRVITNDSACLPATVRVGTRTARTDARGRATLVALVRYLSRPRLRVFSPCGTTQLRLRTRRG